MHFAVWLADRFRSGFVDVPQPYSGRTRRVSLLPSDVHTLVLWSKDFRPVLQDAGGVRGELERYEQLFFHFTITGLGGTALEPVISPWRQAVAQLPELIGLARDARRVVIRFDPIVHWYDGEEVRSNVGLAQPILRAVAGSGVTAVRISFATLYGKVRRRAGWRWYDPSPSERLERAACLVTEARALGLEVYACSQPQLQRAGALVSGCIDGQMLTALHPRHLQVPTRKDSGQRRECACTTSVDVGSYQMRCPNGCRYCYANPLLRPPSACPTRDCT